tara:strand:- start:89 stop:382 length:294 start_codon:yes stop_codon:yes gene_type:complete
MRDQAIYETHPNVISYDEEHGCFDKDGNLVKIDESLVEAKLAELQADYDAKKYQRDRAVAFPSWQEQLDMQYWDKVNGTNKWQEAVAKVKADNPKPE